MTPEEILLRDAFLLGIELKLFWLVALLYGISFIIGISYLISSNSGVGKTLTWGLRITLIIHTILIIFRTFEGMRPPFQNLYETLSWFAWFANATYLYAQSRWREVHLPGFIVAGIAMAACLYSLLTRSPVIAPVPPALQSHWYEVHVITAFLSYAVFVVSFSVEVCFLKFKINTEESPGMFGYMDENFRRWTHRLVLFGFPLLTFAVFSGAAWANDAWGRYWSWDPKETWSLITWTVYAMYLHSKTISRWKGPTASVLNILGFICMIMTFIGVNWLVKLLDIPSLHTYAV
ncbi:MAG TPA: c-type cytochrome biogenesis protein CcsB [Nitrospirae bacterium]|nr:cytochrome c biogenesis protein CcsA [bacterium BMS3Abin06]HDH13154.1 c-type cytochrome biogenesis protein CcsB [Nitrospirota bacterium]HDZ03290.1 c-type cytochrome biogenesis protein CcsB [Nitrospirota bacterium]